MQDILNGEIEAASILTDFFWHFVAGPDVRRGNTECKRRRIQSICDDVVYAVTPGHPKPAKQLKFGLAMKKLTSSRKEIFNRFG